MSSPDAQSTHLTPPDTGVDWLGLSDQPLPVETASSWVIRPDCGAVVTFCGTARDHSDGRPDVRQLDYEAYTEQVVPRLVDLVADMRARWPEVGRVAMLHRVGSLAVTEAAVVVAVSTPHRDSAFEAARFGIDTLKSTTPIWKKEAWADGESWGLEAQHLTQVDAAP